MAEEFDVLVIGAGLSGVAAGYYLKRNCPNKSFAVLEMRDAVGGTWDLFRYPGVRCDSDMHQFAYPFRPWQREDTLAQGHEIRDYIEDTAREFEVQPHIRFRHKVVSADWSSDDSKWTLVVERTDTGERLTFVTRFVISCTGYYDYDAGYTPDYPGRDRYQGEFVHPQFWSDGLEYAGKRVVVIGSGATAVTLIPAMAHSAAKVTMLQRSPSYVASIPRKDPLARLLHGVLPRDRAAWLVRWKNILMFQGFFEFCRHFPGQARQLLMNRAREFLGDDYDVDTHFSPAYKPWDQRLCLVPDGDLFEAIKSGKAEVVTDHIETFTEQGIKLSSGRELPADMIVSATGLNIKMLGGVEANVDGEAVVPGDKYFYRGCMFSDVPNLAMIIGYTNSAWTLKLEVVNDYLCRILRHMDDRGYDVVVPRLRDPAVQPRPLVEMTSGYFNRVRDKLPKNGSKLPWKLYQNFVMDRFMLRRTALEDGALEFQRHRSSDKAAWSASRRHKQTQTG